MICKYKVGQIIEIDGKQSIIIEVTQHFYDAMPLDAAYWSVPCQEQALSQGWGIFEVDGKLEIQRYDEYPRFDNDSAAQNHVKQSGDILCRKALGYVLLCNADG